jgi:hypothetical protein
MDYSRKAKLSRKVQALPHNYTRMRPIRELHAELLTEDAGSRYPGLKGVIYGEVINLLQEARIALALSMSANSPRYLSRTHNASKQVRAFAMKCGRALNAWSPRIRLQQSLRTNVADAFFSIGVGKCYMADSLPIQLENDVYINPGMPFYAPRSVDHMVWDMDATDFRYCSIIADRYQADCEYIQEEKRIPASLRNLILKAGPDTPAAEALGEHINSGVGWSSDDAQVRPWVYFADAYDPKEKVVSTWLVDECFEPKIDEPLYEMKWEFRPEGPHHFLNLGYVPHHTVPSSPAQNLINLHNFVNTLVRKLQDQAELQKRLTVSKAGDEEDAQRVRTAQDGSHIGLNNPDSIKQLNLDGPDQNIFTLMVSMVKMFDRAGGNLEQRLGLGPSSGTAKQDEMIGSQVSRLEAFYQLQFVDFVREIGREQFRMLFADAATEIPMSVQIPGTDAWIQDDWLGAYEEGARYGDVDEFDVDLDPYSMQYKSPSQRMATIDARVAQLLPLEPLLNQRGKGLNIDKYLELAARYDDMPEITELYEQVTPMPMGPEGSSARLLSGGGQNEYLHRSVGSGAPQGGLETLQMAAPQSQGSAA